MINKIISQIWDKIWIISPFFIFFTIIFIIIFSIVKFILIIINFLMTYYKDILLVSKYIFKTIILPFAIVFLIISLFNTINLHFISKKLDSLKPSEKEKYIKKNYLIIKLLYFWII
ncbi:MAG: hypothetical protein N2485_01765 [bacterium]|nr:hypothetical protein [bacterium]